MNIDSVILATTLYSHIMRDVKDTPKTITQLLSQYSWLTKKFPNYTIKGIGRSLCAMSRKYNNRHINIVQVSGTYRYMAAHA